MRIISIIVALGLTCLLLGGLPENAYAGKKGGKKKAAAAEASAENTKAKKKKKDNNESNSVASLTPVATTPVAKDYWPTELSSSVTRYQASDYEGALKSIQQLRYSDQHADKRLLLKGMVLEKLGRHSEAVQALQESRKAKPSNSDTLYYLATAMRGTGNIPTTVIPVLEEATWFNKFTLVTAANAYFDLGNLYRSIGDSAKATDALGKSIDKDKDNTASKIARADIDWADGKTKEAIAAYRGILAAAPDDATAKQRLATSIVNANPNTLKKSDFDEAKTVTASLLGDKQGEARFQDPAFPINLRSMIRLKEFDSVENELNSALGKFPTNAEFLRIQKQLEIEKVAAEKIAAEKKAEEDVKSGAAGVIK